MEIWAKSIPVPIPPFPIFFAFFAILYLLAYFLIFKNWTPNLRPIASSCFISLFHGSPAAILATLSLLTNHSLSSASASAFAAPNTPFQNLVLEYSVAYFTMDLIHYLIFYPSDILFIGHHLATLFVFLTCRFAVTHGAFAILSLLILAEVTSFLQNVWTLANSRRFDADFAAKVYAILSPPFYVLYTIVRGFLGPMFVYRMVGFYVSGGVDGLIPRWVWVSWVVVVSTAIMVSILWIWNLWVDLIRERSRGFEKKLE